MVRLRLLAVIPAVIAIIYLGLVLTNSLQQNDGYLGALLDDTWIHIRFADNIANGNGLSYNDGVLTTGATSPLWVLLLSAVYAITNPDITQQLHFAIGLSALGYVATVLSITGFGWYVTRKAWIGVLAGIITALTGRLVWMGLSGMEMTTFSTMSILAFWSHVADVRNQRVFGWRTGIITALATLARPEGYLLALLIGFDAFVLVPLRNNKNLFKHGLPGWRGIVAYLLLAGSYPIASLLISGYPLPNTFRAKSELGEQFPNLAYNYFWQPRVDHSWLLVLLMFIGIVFLLRRAWRDHNGFVWIIWPVAFVVAVIFMGADNFIINNSRYVSPAIPFHALLAAVGVWAVMEFGRRDAKNRVRDLLPSILAVLLVALTFWLGREQGPQVANDVKQLKAMHVTAGEWFTEVTEPDELIALNDVGAIVHVSDRSVLDMIGLVSVDVLEAVADTERFTCPHDLAIARVMLERQPKLIGVFPWFFPCLTGWEGALQPFNVFTITGPTVIAGGEMVVYWPVWENWPIYESMPSSVNPVDIHYEQGILLQGYEAEVVENGLQVRLWWQPNTQPDGDYTMFVHLIDGDGNIIAQRDSRPQNDQFNTEWWRPGDIIHDARVIELNDLSVLENDDLALRIGVYPTGGGDRLKRVAAPIGEEDFAIIRNINYAN